jgi:tellurite resistance protein TehA-like permease
VTGRLTPGPIVNSRLTGGLLGRTLDSIPPAVGAEVMATAVVSIGLSLDGQETLSRVLLAIAVVIWVGLALLVPLRAARDLVCFRADARTPAALTASVATAVLGTRMTLLGWTWAGIAALAIAILLWAALLRPLLAGWKFPTVGVSLLPAVSTEALAVLAATLAAPEHARWLLIVALVSFALGLVLYVIVISGFDVRQFVVSCGDHWITGGALGISALAATKIMSSANTLDILQGPALEDIALGLWVLTMLWLLVLLFAEARWRRPQLGPARWSTVFPFGMYAASSFAVGAAVHAAAITSFARVWIWIALASWAIVSVATIGRAVEVVRGRESPNPRTAAPTT